MLLCVPTCVRACIRACTGVCVHYRSLQSHIPSRGHSQGGGRSLLSEAPLESS
jgi:hypothetical protein